MKKNAIFGLLVFLLAFGFIGCDNGNENANEVFTSSTNETILNDINSLGLVGTSVSSSDVNIATAAISSVKIKITSVGEGSAVITVSESSKNAAINITVSKTGSITIGTIIKYSDNIQLPYIGEWVANHPSLDINAPDYIIISLNNDYTFVFQEEKNSIKNNVIKGTFSVLNNIITMTITHGWTGGVDAHWDNSEQIMNNIKAYYAPDLLIIGQLNENTLIWGEGEQQIIFSKNNN